MRTRVARCSCEGLRVVCTGEPVRISVCHCLAYRRRTGSAFSVNATFWAESVQTEGEFHTFARVADSGRGGRFHFCLACGATVFYDLDVRPGMTSVPVGAFADEDFPAPTIEVYGARRARWCTLDPRIVSEPG